MSTDVPPVTTRERVLLAGYTVLVAGVLAAVIDWQAPQSFDTGIRIWLLTQPWSALLHNVSRIELTPPFWHLLAKSLLASSPLSAILTLRVLNYLLFVSMVPVGYHAGRLFAGRKTAWGTALLIPWSSITIYHVTRTHHYTLYAVLAVAYTAALVALLRAPTRRRFVAYTGTTLAFSFTHYHALTYVGGTVLVATVLHGWQHDRRRVLRRTWADVRRSELGTYRWFDSPSLLPLFVPFLPVGLLYVAWSPVFYFQYLEYSSPPAYSSMTGLATAAVLFVANQLPAFGSISLPLSPGIVTTVFVTIPLGAVGLWRVVDGRDRVQLVVVGSAVVGAATLVLSGRFYSPRHGLWMAAIAPLVMGLGAATVMNELRERVSGPDSTLVAVGVCALLAVSAAPAVATVTETTEPETNVDRAADIVRASAASDSVVLSVDPWGEYILRAHGVDVPVYGVPEDAVDGNRAVDTRSDYSPETHPEDLERVRRLVEGKERVVVFNAHGRLEDRLPPLIEHLEDLGFTVVRSYEDGENGAIVLEREP